MNETSETETVVCRRGPRPHNGSIQQVRAGADYLVLQGFAGGVGKVVYARTDATEQADDGSEIAVFVHTTTYPKDVTTASRPPA